MISPVLISTIPLPPRYLLLSILVKMSVIQWLIGRRYFQFIYSCNWYFQFIYSCNCINIASYRFKQCRLVINDRQLELYCCRCFSTGWSIWGKSIAHNQFGEGDVKQGRERQRATEMLLNSYLTNQYEYDVARTPVIEKQLLIRFIRGPTYSVVSIH